MESLEQSQKDMRADINAIRSDLHEVKLMMAEAKGAWKAAVAIAGVAGAVIGALMSFVVQMAKSFGG